MTEPLTILQGDCCERLRELPDASVHCVVTSPPYWGLRDYGMAGQIGLEKSIHDYIASIVSVFSEVFRVLRDDGTLWLNLGDSYASTGGHSDKSCNDRRGEWNIGNRPEHNHREFRVRAGKDCDPKRGAAANGQPKKHTAGLKAKDLCMIPARCAIALQESGWYIRSEITWCKSSPMPESVTDRPTSATEKVFLLTKSAKYFYDADAVRRPPSEAMLQQIREGYNGHGTKLFESNGVQNASSVKSRIIENARKRVDKQRGRSRRHAGFNDRWDHMTRAEQMACGSNMRNYWMLGPEPFPDSHFATFPTEVPRRAIMAGCPVGGVVLDPFAGSGTTGMVALELGRRAVLIELNPEYIKLIRQRTNVTPGLALA